MLTSLFSEAITGFLGFSPTPSQRYAIHQFSRFMVEYNEHQVLIINGYAGTGKTSLIHAFVKALASYETNSVLMAPTGRAAKVLSNIAQKQAFTIHKQIYRQKNAVDQSSGFGLSQNLHKSTIFIVDEASMISNQSMEGGIFGSGRLLDDLIEYTFSGDNSKLILVGDLAQLPPVGVNQSPALEQEAIEAYGLQCQYLTLTDVVRQGEGSGILTNATSLRDLLREGKAGRPTFKVDGFRDFIPLSGEDLIESISSSYDREGMEETMVVCRSNKRANLYNQGIRNQILWRDSELSPGDLLLVVKNNYFWLPEEYASTGFIANGDILEVKRIRAYQDLYGLRFADVLVSMRDYSDLEFEAKIMLSTLTHDGPSLSEKENQSFYEQVLEDYADLGSKAQIYKALKSDSYFNALQVKFAYAVTCHKAQGGQWKHVYVDQGFIDESQMDREYLRWLYTAVTRGREKVFLVNFPTAYFQS